MAKRNRTTTSAKIQKRVKAGRGQGKGADYLPWLTIQDVPSQGLATRIRGHKTKRVHHLLSKLETDFFSVLELSPEVIDIREQYPLLPLDETLAIAEACGIHHPTDPKSREPVVMTTDFVVTRLRQEKREDVARTIKYCRDLDAKRTVEKLEIERRYWKAHQVDWGIVTEREIPSNLVQNARLLHDYLESPGNGLKAEEIEVLIETLTVNIKQNGSALRTIALDCDRQLGFEKGTSLAFAYHLIATQRWPVDWELIITPSEPLHLNGDSTTFVGGLL